MAEAKTALQLVSQDGRYKLVLQGDRNLVAYDDTGHAFWASHTRLEPTPPPPPPPPPPEPEDTTPIVGRLRPYGSRGVQDDTGPRLVLGASDFSLLRLAMNDWSAAEARVRGHWSNGFSSCRPLAQVYSLEPGDVWDGLEIDIRRREYDAALVALYDLAIEIGFRYQLTLLGGGFDRPVDGGAHMMARQEDRLAFVRRHAALLRGREHAVVYVAMINEGFGTSRATAADMLEMEALFQSLTGGLIMTGTTSVPDPFEDNWERTQGQVRIAHLDRDTRRSDGHSRPGRQPYGPGMSGARWSDEEAIGFESSVVSEPHGHHLRQNRTTAVVCGACYTLYHSHDGVYGGPVFDDPGYRTARRMRYLMPLDVANGHLKNSHEHYQGRVFTVHSRQLTTARPGVGLARFYTTSLSTGLVVGTAVGMKSDFEMVAEKDYGRVRVVSQRLMRTTQEWDSWPRGMQRIIEKPPIEDDRGDPYDQIDDVMVLAQSV